MIRPQMFNKDWEIKPLGQVAEFLDHIRKPVTESERTEGPYPYYGANGIQGNINDYLFDEPLILLAEDGGYFGYPDRTIAYQVSGKVWVNNHAHVLRPQKDIDIRFLCRQLEKYDVTPYVNGATRAKLTKSAASEIPICVPPLDEQKRISAILDKADAIRIKRQQSIQLADEFLRSVFFDMFGDPITNNKGWRVNRLDKVSEFENGDRSSNYPSGDDLKSSGVLFLNTKNISKGEIVLREPVFITQEKFNSLSRGKLRRNDIVITLRGTLGSCAKFDCVYDTGFINAQLMIIRPCAEILPDFLLAFLTSSSIQAKLKSLGQGAAVPQLTATQIASFDIYCPPLEIQKRFVQVKEKANHLAQKFKKSESWMLFESLNQNAFSGEL